VECTENAGRCTEQLIFVSDAFSKTASAGWPSPIDFTEIDPGTFAA
jgi:hypothetical protein